MRCSILSTRWNSFVQPAASGESKRRRSATGGATGGIAAEKAFVISYSASPLFVVSTLANPPLWPRPIRSVLYPSRAHSSTLFSFARSTPRIHRRRSYLSRDNYRGGQVDSIQSVSRRDSFRFEDCEVLLDRRVLGPGFEAIVPREN